MVTWKERIEEKGVSKGTCEVGSPSSILLAIYLDGSGIQSLSFVERLFSFPTEVK